jgi:uncharacterized membrane protein
MKWFTWAVLSAFFAGLTALLAKVRVAYVNSKSAIAVRTMWVISFPAMLIPVFSATLLAHNFTRNRRAPMLYFESALSRITNLRTRTYFSRISSVRLPF